MLDLHVIVPADLQLKLPGWEGGEHGARAASTVHKQQRTDLPERLTKNRQQGNPKSELHQGKNGEPDQINDMIELMQHTKAMMRQLENDAQLVVIVKKNEVLAN